MKILAIAVSFLASLPAIADGSSRCQDQCEAPPMCEAYALSTESAAFPGLESQFQLWSVGVVTSNPSPGNYQIESYGIPGTPDKPGHLIFITYGYVDAHNPSGGCELAMVDGQSMNVPQE